MKVASFCFTLILIFVFCQSGKMQTLGKKDKKYVILNMQGYDGDIRKIFFLAPKGFVPKPEDIKIHYYAVANSITISYDSNLIGYYDFEQTDTGAFINNYPPLRSILSYIDQDERRYKIDIKKRGRKVELNFTNNGIMNVLAHSLSFVLSKAP